MELASALVTRSIELPVSTDEAWVSLRDAHGLAGWLGDAVDLDVVPGAAGTITEGDAVRRVVVTEVVEGHSIGLVWWDETAPEEASVVTIAVTPSGEGAATVTVTEQLAGSATASIGAASIGDLVAVEGAWDRRLQALVGEPALAPACV
jgi:uncharacterized protein YndB with AHSA1/START domain